MVRRRAASLVAGLTLTTAAAAAPYRQETKPLMPRLPRQFDDYDGKGEEGGNGLHGVRGSDESKMASPSKAFLPISRENLREFSGGFSPEGSRADEVDLESSRGSNRWMRRDRGGFVDDLDPFESSSALTVAETWGSEASPGALSGEEWRTDEDGERDALEGEWTWQGAFRGVFGALKGSLWVSLEVEWRADDGGEKVAEVEALMEEEQRGHVKSYRRGLQTSSSDDSGVLYKVTVVSTTGPTSSDWNGAKYTLAVSTPVFGQSQRFNTIIGTGTVNETDETPLSTPFSLERGCYELYTTAGSRPYDVVWEVQTYDEGEDATARDAAEGGGQDEQIFGVGGALCGLSTCYRNCYLDAEDISTDACASFGDLLAPLTETAGARCNCTSADEQMDLRLACLSRGCDEISQCYIMNSAETIESAFTLRITTYITLAEDTALDEDAIVVAMAQWLDFDPDYVQLTDIDGHAVDTSAASSSDRRLETFDEAFAEDTLEMARHRRSRVLQTGQFKRLEFLIISSDSGDFEDATSTIDAGIRGFNTVLAAQDEESGLTTAEAYTAEYSISEEDVPASDIPEVEGGIAGTGSGQGVNELGDIIEGTEAPADDSTDFTTEAQFLVGAGLVVVVSIALSIVACIVCHMKSKERREFRRKNEPINGRARPVEYVDPWGSVARTFQNDSETNSTVNIKSGAGSTNNGSHSRSANGSHSHAANGFHSQ